MRLVFADTLYWGAILHPHDQYRSQTIRARKALGEAHLVTTDEVLAELLDGLAQRGPDLREAGTQAVRRILDDGRVTVHPQSRESSWRDCDCMNGALTRATASWTAYR